LPLFRPGWEGPVLATSTAGEFTEKGDAKGAVAAVAGSGEVRLRAGVGLGVKTNPEKTPRQALEGLQTAVPGLPHQTALLLLDPLAGNGEETVALASRLLGPQTRLAGGAAGDDLAMRTTFVGLNEHVASDAVVLATLFSKQPLG